MGTTYRRAGAFASRRLKLTLLATTALAATAPGFANASPVGVPDPSYYNVVVAEDPGYPRFQGDTPYASQGTQQPTGGLLVTGATPYNNSVYTATTDNNYTIPSIDAAARVSDRVEAQAESSLTYYLEFGNTGGTASVTIPVFAHGEASSFANEAGAFADSPQYDSARALVYIEDTFLRYGEVMFGVANSDLVSNLGTHTFTFDQPVTFRTNILYKVVMDVDASATDDHTAAAFADPYFDLSNLPADVTFSISNGIGNALPPSTTPIPAALPLFAGGLGMIGLLARRKRQKKTLASA